MYKRPEAPWNAQMCIHHVLLHIGVMVEAVKAENFYYACADYVQQVVIDRDVRRSPFSCLT